MPSTKGFFGETIDIFQRLCFARVRTRDKLRIFGVLFWQLISKAIRKRISASLDKKIEGITEKLWRGTVIEVDGIKYALLDFESFEIVSSLCATFESFMPLWLKPRRGEVLVDIGAHIGKYTLTTAKVVGNEGMVVAIEPHPVNYQTLQRNIGLNKLENAMALNLAAWNTDCELKLFTGDVAGHHSVKVNRRIGWVEVKARVTDHVLKELRLDRVDWIKIDVEGAESEVLCGLEETISKYKPKIITEVFYENVHARTQNVDEMKKFMKKHGYGLIRISPFFEDFVMFTSIPFSHKRAVSIKNKHETVG
jgi:FkbM family methyltransferase